MPCVFSMATRKSAKLVSIPLPNIPHEIITEILLRLPVKSLLRFRCVSKSWLSIISCPLFIKTHLEISTNNNIYSHQRIIFGSGTRPSVFGNGSLYPKVGEDGSMDTVPFDYPLSDPDDEIRIVGSCNGLICVALVPCNIILWNPAIRRSRLLPVSCKNAYCRRYGFGYDVSNDEYKVVEFSWIDDLGVDETQIHVYSSRNDSWKKVDGPYGKLFDDPGVFVNGAIHWKAHYKYNPRDLSVIAQNSTTDKFEVIALPPCGNDHEEVFLGVLGGCFSAFYDYLSYMDVWVLKEYGVRDSWSKLVCFPYYSLCTRRLVHVRPKLLFVWENGVVLLNLGSELIMHKPSQYHEVHRLGDGIELEAATYSESLISPYIDGQGLFVQAPLPALTEGVESGEYPSALAA